MSSVAVRNRREARAWFAISAAFLLVLQALLAGLSSGAQAAPVQRDYFGGIICAFEGTSHSPDDGAPGAPSHVPNCCILGCSMFGPSVAPPPDLIVLHSPALVALAARRPPTLALLGLGAERTPRQTRAPPLA